MGGGGGHKPWPAGVRRFDFAALVCWCARVRMGGCACVHGCMCAGARATQETKGGRTSATLRCDLKTVSLLMKSAVVKRADHRAGHSKRGLRRDRTRGAVIRGGGCHETMQCHETPPCAAGAHAHAAVHARGRAKPACAVACAYGLERLGADLERQGADLERRGADLERTSLSEWVVRARAVGAVRARTSSVMSGAARRAGGATRPALANRGRCRRWPCASFV